jgi:hypothetical protein
MSKSVWYEPAVLGCAGDAAMQPVGQVAHACAVTGDIASIVATEIGIVRNVRAVRPARCHRIIGEQ